MPTNHTANYSLSQWEPGDAVLRTDFNADNAKIDAALTAKAEKSALDALSRTVSGHTSSLSAKGNCRIWTTSYTGNGQYGSGKATSVSFPKVPVVAFVLAENGGRATFFPGQTEGYAQFGTFQVLAVSWNGSTLQWSNHQSALGQLNESGKSYHVVALLTA